MKHTDLQTSPIGQDRQILTHGMLFLAESRQPLAPALEDSNAEIQKKSSSMAIHPAKGKPIRRRYANIIHERVRGLIKGIGIEH